MRIHIDSRVFSCEMDQRIKGLRELATALERDLTFTHEGAVVTVEADWESITDVQRKSEADAKRFMSIQQEDAAYERSMEG